MKNIYKPYQVPPDWNLATQHMRATRPGKHISLNKNDSHYLICPCCYSYIEKFKIPYFYADKQLFFLGEGFPLFYNTIKFSCAMIILLLLDSSAIQIIMNYTSYFCHDTCQHTNIFNRLSNASVIQSFPQYRVLIRICGFIGQLLLLLYFRDSQSVLSNILDERNCNLSDYSIHIKGIPQLSNNNSQKIKNILNQQKITFRDDKIDKLVLDQKTKTNKQKVIIHEILLLENLSEFYSLEKQVRLLVDKKIKCIEELSYLDSIIYGIEQKDIEARRVELLQRMSREEKKFFTGEAIVVFDTQQDRDNAIEFFSEESQQKDAIIRDNYQNYDPNIEKFRVSKALEPSEIIWKNCYCSSSQRLLTLIVGWILALLLLAVLTIGAYYLISYKAQLVQEFSKDEYNITIAYSIGIGITVCINIINTFVISPLLYSISQKIEKHRSYAEQEYSSALKCIFSTFFTTALVLLVVQGIIFRNYTGTLGLTSEESFIFAFNAYFIPVLMIINPYYMCYWIKRKLNQGNKNMTQQQANEIMEYPRYNLGKRFSWVIKTVWFTFLYAQLIPLGTALSCSGLIIYYFVDKYTLLRKSSVVGNISASLFKDLLPIMEFTLVIKPFGQFLFEYQIQGIYSIQSMIMMGIGVIYIFFPKDKFISCCCVDNYNKQIITYQDIQQYVKHSYSTLYPARRDDVLHKTYEGKPNFIFVKQNHQNINQSTESLNQHSAQSEVNCLAPIMSDRNEQEQSSTSQKVSDKPIAKPPLSPLNNLPYLNNSEKDFYFQEYEDKNEDKKESKSQSMSSRSRSSSQDSESS